MGSCERVGDGTEGIGVFNCITCAEIDGEDGQISIETSHGRDTTCPLKEDTRDVNIPAK